MYEKKLNGILADEMGLGKTIQTIALLAHLACEKGNKPDLDFIGTISTYIDTFSLFGSSFWNATYIFVYSS